MAAEASKSGSRFLPYLTGKGIDIGCGADPILPDAFCWDREQGDAQLLEDIPDASFDWVFSSHCIEHMHNPIEAVLNWWRVLRPGGYMVLLAPDEDLYEQRCWPSIFNDDHKHTWTIHKDHSWSIVSYNLIDVLRYLPGHKIHRLEIFSTNYNHNLGGVADQSLMGAEVSVAAVVEKVTDPGKGRTQLETVYRCPKCGSELICRGKLVGSPTWSVRCTRCDVVGKMNL